MTKKEAGLIALESFKSQFTEYNAEIAKLKKMVEEAKPGDPSLTEISNRLRSIEQEIIKKCKEFTGGSHQDRH